MKIEHQARKAFTLIEMLMVIGIIAILAGMFLPVLTRAKNNASRANDISNFKQLMMALHSYSSDNGDELTPPNGDDGGTISTNSGWLYTPDMTETGSRRFKVETGLLWPGLRNPRLYFCTMDNPLAQRFSKAAGRVMPRRQQLSSYAMNGAVNDYSKIVNDKVVDPVKLSALRPDDCAFWETDETDPYNFNDGANRPDEGVSGRHYQGAIQASFDGSAGYINLKTWFEFVADTNRNRLWCFPGSPDGR